MEKTNQQIVDEISERLYTYNEVQHLLLEQQRRYKLVHKVIWLTKPIQLKLVIERIDLTEDGQVVYVR